MRLLSADFEAQQTITLPSFQYHLWVGISPLVLRFWNSKDDCLIKWYNHKCEWAFNNRVAVVPAITYSNNKVWVGVQGERGRRRVGNGVFCVYVCVCVWEGGRQSGAVVEIVPKGSGSRKGERGSKSAARLPLASGLYVCGACSVFPGVSMLSQRPLWDQLIYPAVKPEREYTLQ